MAAAVLLTAATSLLALSGDPTSLTAEAAVAMSAMGSAAGTLTSLFYLAPQGWWVIASGIGFGSCIWLARAMGAWSREAR